MSARAEASCPADARALIEGEPSAAASLLIGTIAALVLALLGWLAWAQVEEVVQAPGRAEPSGRVKIVNHPRGGRVAALHVRDGDRVTVGQSLLTLDAEMEASERAELLGRWQAATVDAARLEAERAGTALALPKDLRAARPDLAAAAGDLAKARAAQLASRRATASEASRARRAELGTAKAEVARLQKRVGLMRQEREAVRQLAARGLYPNLKLIALEREAGDGEGELAKAQAGVGSTQAALAEAESRLAGVDREWRTGLLDDLARATADRDRLAEQLKARTTLVAGSEIKAPVDGVVQDLAIAGPGQAVGPNDTLMKVVPSDDRLVVEARVANEDIGRVAAGMPAEVKVRAFDYLRYGSLKGTVRRVAADATPDQRSGALAYTVTVEAERDHLGEAPGRFDVVPGMVVDVEVKVGRRTILSYLTDRIWRFREAFREA